MYAEWGRLDEATDRAGKGRVPGKDWIGILSALLVQVCATPPPNSTTVAQYSALSRHLVREYEV